MVFFDHLMDGSMPRLPFGGWKAHKDLPPLVIQIHSCHEVGRQSLMVQIEKIS